MQRTHGREPTLRDEVDVVVQRNVQECVLGGAVLAAMVRGRNARSKPGQVNSLRHLVLEVAARVLEQVGPAAAHQRLDRRRRRVAATL